MSRRWVILLGALGLAAVVLGSAWAGRQTSVPTPSASPGHARSSQSSTASRLPTAPPSSGAGQSTAPSPRATATTAPPGATRPPRASGPPRLAYAAFLRRVNADRAMVATLNGALSTAAQAQDPAAVRHAAVDILDFVDTERDWLRDNPPSDCYAAAHASAGAMLDAYGAAADASIAWAQTGGGFAGIGALGKALDAAGTASDALTSFGHAIEATRCPG